MFDLISSSLPIAIPSICGLYISLYFLCLCVLTSAVFQFFIFENASIVSALWNLQYFISLYLTLFSLSLHIDWHLQYFSSLYFILLSSCLHINICSLSVLYILICFPRLCMSTAAVFQFCIFYSAFLASTFWHLRYCSSVYFTYFIRLCIIICAVFESWIFDFPFFLSAYWHLQYLSCVFYFACFVCSRWHHQHFNSV